MRLIREFKRNKRETHREVNNFDQAAVNNAGGALLLNLEEGFERVAHRLCLSEEGAFGWRHEDMAEMLSEKWERKS